MGIPSFTDQGFLPPGEHVCSLVEVASRFGVGGKRRELWLLFEKFVSIELRPRFAELIYINGSFVTDKADPCDVDVVLDLRNSNKVTQYEGFLFMQRHRASLHDRYKVDFLVNLAEQNNFVQYFQYVGPKVAHKGLSANALKGILRVRDE